METKEWSRLVEAARRSAPVAEDDGPDEKGEVQQRLFAARATVGIRSRVLVLAILGLLVIAALSWGVKFLPSVMKTSGFAEDSGGKLVSRSSPRPTVSGTEGSSPGAQGSLSASPSLRRNPQEGKESVTVDVSGAVRTPGVYRMPSGSRVEDALKKAGGALPEANLEELNRAALLADAQKIFVPLPGQAGANSTPRADQPGQSSPSEGATINVNTATLQELESLPKVGPSLAQRIIDYRQSNGPFSSLEDLDEVKGIGPSVLEAIAERVRFQ